MFYNHSQIDTDNFEWFQKDNSKATLLGIQLTRGSLRSLNTFEIDFQYPISVIAGKNGSGKSTILALAACAFHNSRNGFKIPERERPYYTFSDFFIQSKEEISPEGVRVVYKILYDKWKYSDSSNREGIGYQTRFKKVGGNGINIQEELLVM